MDDLIRSMNDTLESMKIDYQKDRKKALSCEHEWEYIDVLSDSEKRDKILDLARDINRRSLSTWGISQEQIYDAAIHTMSLITSKCRGCIKCRLSRDDYSAILINECMDQKEFVLGLIDPLYLEDTSIDRHLTYEMFEDLIDLGAFRGLKYE